MKLKWTKQCFNSCWIHRWQIQMGFLCLLPVQILFVFSPPFFGAKQSIPSRAGNSGKWPFIRNNKCRVILPFNSSQPVRFFCSGSPFSHYEKSISVIGSFSGSLCECILPFCCRIWSFLIWTTILMANWVDYRLNDQSLKIQRHKVLYGWNSTKMSIYPLITLTETKQLAVIFQYEG